MRRWAVALILTLGVIIAYIDRTNLSIALADPGFKAFFQLTDSQRGFVNSAFFWTYTLMQIPAGLIVDRYGVRWPLALGLLAWCAASASTALATVTWQLIAIRLLLGLGEATVFPGGLSWIARNMREEERGLAMGLFLSGTKWGPAIAAPLSTWLVTAYGWREMFVFLGIGGALWIVPWLLLARDGRERGAPQQEQRVVPLMTLLALPQMWGTLIGTFCYNYFLFYSLTWLPAYFVERRHLSLNSMGFFTMFSFAGTAIVAILSGYAADALIKRGYDAVRVRRGFTVAGLLVASTEVFGALAASNEVAIFFVIFSMTGLGLATANYWALTQSLMPGIGGGRIGGLQNTALNLAGIVAPIVTGWLKESTGSYTAPMQAIGVVLLIGVGAYLGLIREPVRFAALQPSR